MNKPVALGDPDDTFLQTRRKMVDELVLESFRTGTVDYTLNPRNSMTEEQSMLVDWLLEQAELIPVTTRGTEEISRVRTPFHSWAITTHGVAILTPEGKPDEEWKAHMFGQLAPYQEKLTSMQRLIIEMMDVKGINAWARLNFEYGETAVYMVIKHRDSTRLDKLNIIADETETVFPTEGFYIHRNSNNMAWLPIPVEKGLAVRWLLGRLRAKHGIFPITGLGDSLSDHRSMKPCSWFGVPHQSQFANAISQRIFGEN